MQAGNNVTCTKLPITHLVNMSLVHNSSMTGARNYFPCFSDVTKAGSTKTKMGKSEASVLFLLKSY